MLMNKQKILKPKRYQGQVSLDSEEMSAFVLGVWMSASW